MHELMLRGYTAMVLREDMEPSRDDGATAVEYALIATLIAVVIVVAVTLLGGRLSNLYESAANSIP